MSTRILLVVALLGGCDETLSSAEQESANLDDTATAEASGYELTMHAGRESRLPLSRVFDGVRATGPIENIRIRARCLDAAVDACDPGLVVVADRCTTPGCATKTRTVLFNNDSAQAGGNGKGAFVSATSTFGATYRAIAYSHLLRGTSRIAVEWSLDGTTFSSSFTDPVTQAAISGASQIVGGTLLRVGPVHAGDYLGVRTADDGASVNTGTRLYAFDTVRGRFAFADGATTGDRDPMVDFDDTWSTAFAIAAKDVARPADGGPGLEAVADLIRGPLTSEALVPLTGGNCVGTTSANSTTRTTCTGTAIALGIGQYQAYAYAHTAGKGVGRVMAGGAHPASGTGDPDCGDVQRGRANDLGFTMRLLRDGQVIATRHIPRGAIGSEGFDDPNDPSDTPWDRFLIAFDVTEPGHTFAVDIANTAVVVRGQWGWARNPETVDLKVASLNIEPHADGAQTTAMMNNTAELLGTRVRYESTGAITDRANRGQWQWEADVVALQEIYAVDAANTMRARLESRTARNWDMKWALGTWKNRTWPVPNYTSFAPIFAGSQVFANATDRINFTPAQLAAAGCAEETSQSDSDTGACWISTDPDGDLGYEEKHYVVPARTKVTRIGGAAAGSSSRPIAIFNFYMSDDHLAVRRAGASVMRDKIAALLEANPAAFNVDGVADPKWRGNRMILLGDSNMDNHGCSEVNETLVKLRDAFGYAVEVPMAQLDLFNRTMDTHYSGAPITDPQQGIYGDCNDPLWAHLPWTGTATGCPYHFAHVDWWHGQASSPAPGDPTVETGAKYAVDPSQWYAWWGATSAGGNGGSRLDTIILVGRGWAYDDPVIRYGTLSDVNFVNANNDYLGGGVEIMKPTGSIVDVDCSATDTPNLVTVPGSYAPAEALAGASTAEGQPVVCTDHKPVGARLRISFVR